MRSILEANLKTSSKKQQIFFGQIADNRAQTLATTILAFYKPALKLIANTSDTLGQIADTRAKTLGITICAILGVNLKTTSKNRETLGQIADNMPQP